MIYVTYKGQNYILFGKTKIVNGVNAVNDDEFYRLMKTKAFRFRIESGVFKVPEGTPLEKKEEKVKHETLDIDSEDQDIDSNLSMKDMLELISDHEDKDFLNNLVENDSRKKVKEAAKKRIESLKKS